MKTGIKSVCTLDQCVGCMACVDMCPKGAISIADTKQAYNAVINEDLCVNCGICTKVCQNNNKITLKHPQSWYQGWISDEYLRKKSSSGGAARAISQRFISEGGVVVSCCFRNGVFGFETAETLGDLEKFTGSKYVKSDPSGIYKIVQKLLKDGRNVLFIGLPCQVGALKYIVGDNENLYTVDLICHGTPSPNILKDYLSCHRVDINNVKSISFRYKSAFGLEQNGIPLSQPGSCDNYLLAFLCGLDYTENCYSCRYAGISRGSDITIGDSWKSNLTVNEQSKGISIMLCQTQKGEELLKKSEMHLFPVDLKHAVSANDQLREPSKKTHKHDIFFAKYSKKNFEYAVFYSLPLKCIKQKIKAILLKTKLIFGRGAMQSR